MSAIHFDITGDNKNIMAVIEQTTKGFEDLADFMKDLGKEGLDLSNSEKSIEVLGQVLEGLMDKMKEYGNELEELQKQQQDAMMAGDADKVKALGDEMESLAEKIVLASNDASKLEAILGTSDKGRKELEKLAGDVEKIEPAMDGATKAAGGFFKAILPGVAKLGTIAGIVSVLRRVANDAISLTQRVGDTWGREVAGWKSSYESFVRSIGSGKGWTEMIQDATRAYTIGKKVFDLMDELFEMQNSLTLAESNYSGQIEENRQIMMDATKSYKERKKAAQDIIDAETKLGEMRQKVADQRLEAATLDLEKDTNLTGEERKFFIEQYNDNQELIQQAVKYGEVQKNLALNQAAYNQTFFTNYGNEKEAREQILAQIEKYNTELGKTPDAVREAFEIMSKYNEGSDKVISTWVQAQAESNRVTAETARATRRAETTKNRVELEEQRANQAYADVRRQNTIKLSRELKNNALEQKQAEIDAMKDGNAKVLAQIDLDYEREKQAIQNWYDDLREEKIRKAKELWDANLDNKGKVFIYNPKSDKWNATAEEQALYNAKNTAADKKYKDKKLEGTNAADDTMNAYLKEYGSFWQKRLAIQKEYQDQIDATEDEWEKKRLARERDNELKLLSRNREYLAASQDYEDQRILIQAEAMDEINDLKEREAELEEKLRNAKTEAEEEAIETEIIQNKRQQEIIAKNTKRSLDDLDDQYSDFYKKLAKDRTEWLVGDTVDLLKDAEKKLAALGDENLADNDTLERIQRLKKEIKGLKQELSQSFTPSGILKNLLGADTEGGGKSFKERIGDLQKAWTQMTATQKWQVVGNYVAKIGNGLHKAADYMREIARISGNSEIADTAETIDAAAQNLSAAAQGAAQGGWIGAVVAGVSDMISQTFEAIANISAQEAIAAKNARDWADALRMAFLEIDESKFDTVFGDKVIGRAQANFNKASEAMQVYQEKLDELNKKYGEQEIKEKEMLSWGANIFAGLAIGTGLPALWGMQKTTSQFKAYQDAINKGYDGLQRMLVKTKDVGGWARFWGAQDQYTALGELAPELWDENGELVLENAKKLLEVNTQLTDEQKEQIKQLVTLKEGYDEAMKVIDDTISGTFGNLASDLTDVIWDSVMSGSDAWERFEEIGAEAISNIGKQLIQEMLISEYLEQFRDRMRSAYKAESADDTQKQMREIVVDIFGGMNQAIAAGSIMAEEYKQWAEQNGFDLAKLATQGQTATAGAFQTMSQDTANELNGRFTALQLSNEVISQSAQAGIEFLSTISAVIGTSSKMVGEIRDLHILEVGYLEDISKYTKTMVGFGEKLDKIEQNTSKL